MKKILILIGLSCSFAGAAQSWDAYYGMLAHDQITARDSIQLLVIDAEKDSTYYMMVSQLDLIWSFDSTYLHYRIDSLSTVLVNLDPMVYPSAGIALSTGTGWGTSITDNSANWNTALQSVDISDINATGTPSASTYLDGSGAWSTPAGSGTVDVSTDVTGEMDTANINMDQLDAKFIVAADSLPIVWGDKITATEAGGELTVNVDDIILTTDVTGVLPVANLPTQATITDTEASIPTSGSVVAYVAANGGGGSALDSTTMWFKDEIQSLWTFGMGRGLAADTAAFELSTIGSYIDRSGDTIVVTNITGGMTGKENDTLGIQVFFGPDIRDYSTSTALMFGNPFKLGVLSTGYAKADSSTFTTDTIPPDNFIWADIVSITDSDSITYLTSTLSGYKIKGTYVAVPYDIVSPTHVSAEVGTLSDSTVVALFDESLDESSVPATSAFSVSAGNTAWTVSSVEVSDDTTKLTMASSDATYVDSTILWSYTVPGTNPLQDAAGNDVVALVNSTVTNNLTNPALNLITDGDFADSTNWASSDHTNLNFVSEEIYFTDVANAHAEQTDAQMRSSILANTDYTLTFDVSNSGLQGLNMIFASSNGAIDYLGTSYVSYTNGSHSVSINVADVGVGGFAIYFNSGGDDGNLDNLVLTAD